jgi:hypothetical protein
MEFGKVVTDPDESRWVVYIYEQYMRGESFKGLSDTLCDTGIHYDGDKPWNKNMVARILQDRRYTGDGKYPPIIDSCIYQQVDQKRNKKVAGSKVTKAKKILKKKSGGRITPHLEHEVLYLLNELAGKPERIETHDIPTRGSSKVEALQAELEELLGMLPVDETQARQKLMETTVGMYEAIDPREYETHRLKRIFGAELARTELDGSLLEQTVTAVTVDSLGKVKIRLKNDQIIERRKCGE